MSAVEELHREIRESERADAARLGADRGWARTLLAHCGADPDNPDTVRDLLAATQDAHTARSQGAAAQFAPEVYRVLVYAIRAAYGFVHWPADWPALNIALLARSARGALPGTAS